MRYLIYRLCIVVSASTGIGFDSLFSTGGFLRYLCRVAVTVKTLADLYGLYIGATKGKSVRTTDT